MINKRNLITALATIVCLGSVWAVAIQRRHLTALRAERQRADAQLASGPPESATTTQSEPPTEPAAPTDNLQPELLRLRSLVTRLTARQRELSGVPEESKRLHASLAGSQTNLPAGASLPAGYIRKAQARLMGYNSPENTFESFLWALQNHDAAKLREALDPARTQRLEAQLQQTESAEAFFKSTDRLPGLAIRSRQDLPDGSVELQVEAAPGLPVEKLLLQPINGQWKMDFPF